MLKQEINGHRLLSTTVEDLPVFNIDKLGHQEIFMGAVDLLREFVRVAAIYVVRNFIILFCFSTTIWIVRIFNF